MNKVQEYFFSDIIIHLLHYNWSISWSKILFKCFRLQNCRTCSFGNKLNWLRKVWMWMNVLHSNTYSRKSNSWSLQFRNSPKFYAPYVLKAEALCWDYNLLLDIVGVEFLSLTEMSQQHLYKEHAIVKSHNSELVIMNSAANSGMSVMKFINQLKNCWWKHIIQMHWYSTTREHYWDVGLVAYCRLADTERIISSGKIIDSCCWTEHQEGEDIILVKQLWVQWFVRIF